MINRNHLKHIVIIGLVAFAFFRYSYAILRLDVSLSDYDTAQMTLVIHSINETGSIINAERRYEHGFSYQAVVIFLQEITGLSLQSIQLFALPLIESIIVIVVFSMYRKLLDHEGIALLAVLMLYMQPDFLWVIFRGAHERFDWPIIMTMIYLLMSSFQSRNNMSLLIRMAILFYMLVFGLASSNTFYSTSFIGALFVCFGLSYVILRYVQRTTPTHSESRLDLSVRRLLYIMLACVIIEYLVLIYIYPVAQTSLFAVKNVIEKFAIVLLNFEPVTNPYQYVQLSWLNPLIYLVINFYTWFVLIVGFLSWINQIIRLYIKRTVSPEEFPRLFLIIAYFGFVSQLGVAVIIDLGGAYGANLQVRVFTGAILLSTPFAALIVWRIIQHILKFKKLRMVMLGILLPLFVFINATSLSKSVNEPIFSQRWLFTTVPEAKAVEWITSHGERTVVWIGLDERILSYMRTIFPQWTKDDILFQTNDRDRFDRDIQYYVLSVIEKIRWQRGDNPIPYLGDENLIYQNGSTDVYYRRAVTPYQK